MKIYDVAVENREGYCSEASCLQDYELDYVRKHEFDWFVYAYYVDYYEGDGEGVAYKDGKLYFYGFSHCSCYGAIEDSSLGAPVSVEDYLNSVDIHDTDCQYKEVRDKVLELLQ